MRTQRKYFWWVILGLALLGIGWGSYEISMYLAHAWGDEADWPEQASIIQYQQDTGLPDSMPDFQAQVWLSSEFLPARFDSPHIQYRPWTRWWWPGNRVESQELKAELIRLAQAGFGGVEIQAFAAGLDPGVSEDEAARISAVNRPSFYQHLDQVLHQARSLGMFVDMTAGSGWPAGGQHVSLDDNPLTLAFGEANVLGGKLLRLSVPEPRVPYAYYWTGKLEQELGHANRNLLDFFDTKAELVELLAARTQHEGRSGNLFDLQDYVGLDADSIFLISDFVEAGELRWEAPAGFWKIIAVYAMPSGESPWFTAEQPAGWVVDPLDSAKVIAHHNYVLGSRSGLVSHYQQSLRGIFHPAFAYQTERHFARDFLTYFRKKRGYELTPYLPVLLYPGRDNRFFSEARFERGPEFRIGAEDERIRFDYARTLSDRLVEHFLRPSRNWAEQRGLLFRAQVFGMEIDLIEGLGETHVPEVDQGYAGGSDLFLKMAGSAAFLAGKPLVSGEAFSHPGRDYQMNPQAMKRALDKLFLAGVNHVVMHGTPYPLIESIYGENGWVPFSSPFMPRWRKAAYIGENSPFWAHQARLNAYASRVQYAMRQGKALVDVLVYYPFLGFPSQLSPATARRESYFDGQMDLQAEPTVTDSQWQLDPRAVWLDQVQTFLQVLEQQGLTWAWVNDASLQTASMETNKLSVRDQEIQMILLPQVSAMPRLTALKLAEIKAQGAKVLMTGLPPTQTPGFEQGFSEDASIAQILRPLCFPNPIERPEQLRNILIGQPINRPLAYAETYPFLRHSIRQLSDSSLMCFFHNQEQADHFFRLQLDPEYPYCYWLDPWEGNIYPMPAGTNLTGLLPAWGSGILYCRRDDPLPDSLQSPMPDMLALGFRQYPVTRTELSHWEVIVEGQDLSTPLYEADTLLFDWREHPRLRKSASEGNYQARFSIGDTVGGHRFVLELGEVYHSVDVSVNTQLVERLITAPYRVEITEYLSPGLNTVELWVTPTLFNRYRGYGHAGKTAYQQFQEESRPPMPAGLLGPVFLLEIETQPDGLPLP